MEKLEPLKGCTGLQVLRAAACTSLFDLAPLAGSSALRTLDLSRCEALSSLAGLLQAGAGAGAAGCGASLQALNLQGCGLLSDIAPLRMFSQLRDLDLSQCSALSSLEPLKGAPCSGMLQRLDISYCGDLVGDANNAVGCLGGCTRLRSLGLSGIQFDLTLVRFFPEQYALGLAGLQQMQLLEELFLDRLALVGPGHPLAGRASVATKLRPWTGEMCIRGEAGVDL